MNMDSESSRKRLKEKSVVGGLRTQKSKTNLADSCSSVSDDSSDERKEDKFDAVKSKVNINSMTKGQSSDIPPRSKKFVSLQSGIQQLDSSPIKEEDQANMKPSLNVK